jgi:hypothetical protein
MATIYKLNFSNGEYYIGQTAKAVETRILQHKQTKGKGCPLLAYAWQTHELVGWEVLEDNISLDQVDAREVYWIKTLKPALNTLAGGKITRGVNHPRAKYTAEQIEDVADLYLNSAASYQEISDITLVEYCTVHDIIKGRSHQWVWDGKMSHDIAKAELLRKPSYKFYDIDNNEYPVTTNLLQAEKHLDLPNGALRRALAGHRSALGWSAVPHPVLELTDPQQEKFVLTQPRALEFLRSFEDLSKYQIDKLVNKQMPGGGWTSSIVSSK